MNMLEKLQNNITSACPNLCTVKSNNDQVIINVKSDVWPVVAKILRDDIRLKFEQLIDLCGVDLQAYGVSNWSIKSEQGFSRGVGSSKRYNDIKSLCLGRFLVVVQLLSITNNFRVTVHIEPEGDEPPRLPSVCNVWASANWFEREAFDLFGIVFIGHPDLRRILTDYGFVGHPFRKDFPLIGKVALEYDEEHKACVYRPINIEERITVPRVIRPQIIEEGE